jgi:hypothetical protein
MFHYFVTPDGSSGIGLQMAGRLLAVRKSTGNASPALLLSFRKGQSFYRSILPLNGLVLNMDSAGHWWLSSTHINSAIP